MASTRRHVILRGVLRGLGREAECTISAEEITLSGIADVAYARMRVEKVMTSLPDGDYDLEVKGQIFRMRQISGAWVTANI